MRAANSRNRASSLRARLSSYVSSDSDMLLPRMEHDPHTRPFLGVALEFPKATGSPMLRKQLADAVLFSFPDPFGATHPSRHPPNSGRRRSPARRAIRTRGTARAAHPRLPDVELSLASDRAASRGIWAHRARDLSPRLRRVRSTARRRLLDR